MATSKGRGPKVQPHATPGAPSSPGAHLAAADPDIAKGDISQDGGGCIGAAGAGGGDCDVSAACVGPQQRFPVGGALVGTCGHVCHHAVRGGARLLDENLDRALRRRARHASVHSGHLRPPLEDGMVGEDVAEIHPLGLRLVKGGVVCERSSCSTTVASEEESAPALADGGAHGPARPRCPRGAGTRRCHTGRSRCRPPARWRRGRRRRCAFETMIATSEGVRERKRRLSLAAVPGGRCV